MSTIIKARSPYTLKETNLVPETVLVNFDCSDIVFTGFALERDGTTTDPTAADLDGNAITITSITPALVSGKRFGEAQITTTRSIYCTFTVPSGYKNTGDVKTCITTTIQQGYVKPLLCQTFKITNNSATIDLVMRVSECGNEVKEVIIAPSITLTICLEPNVYPQKVSGDDTYTIIAQDYGCTTGSNVYLHPGNYGAYAARQDAIDARTNANPSKYVNLYYRSYFPQDNDSGFYRGTVVTTNNTTTIPADTGWYATSIYSSLRTQVEDFEYYVEDGVITEGGFTDNTGAL
jgi:hypothetical protein